MTFKGWDTSSTATNVVFTDGADISSILKGDTSTIIRLYAVWVDDIAPECTWTSAKDVTFGIKKSFKVTCKDYGSKVINQQISTDNFTSNDSSVGQIVSAKSATTKTKLTVVTFYTYVYGAKVGNITLNNNLTISDGAGNTTKIAPKNINVIGKTLTATFLKAGDGIKIPTNKVKCTTTESNDTCDINLAEITETEGYKAVGWSESRNQTSGYDIGSKYTLTKNKSFYSISFFEEATYTANFDANGSTLSSSNAVSCTVPKQYNYVGTTSCKVNMPSISRSGYTVVGFNTKEDATTRKKLSGSALTLDRTNTGQTWYAVTYSSKTVLFNSNGARLSSTSKNCKIYNKETNCTITSPSIIRSGYNIIGFSKDKNDENAIWSSLSKKVIDVTETETPTYYAITNKNVLVTWDANNSSLDFTSSSCKIKNNDSSCNVTSPTITPNENTPIVVGFNSSSNGTESQINSNSTFKVDANATYYAITKNHDITFEANFSANGLTISSTKSSCTVPSTYNGVKQASSCTVISPIIETIEGFLLGFNQNTESTKITLNSGSALELSSTNSGQTWYGVKNEIVPNDSILGYIESNQFNGTSYNGYVLNSNSYRFHIYNYNGDQTWTSNMTFGDGGDIGSSSYDATNTVVVKVNGNLTINSGVTVTAYGSNYGGPCGLIIYATGNIINNGTITMSGKGARAAGQNVHLWKNEDGTYEYIPARGTAGGPNVSQYSSTISKTPYTANGINGGNGTSRGTGGGGSGGVSLARANYKSITATSGYGSTGTSYSGGSGGGGIDMNYSGSQYANNAGENGGSGGNAYSRRGNSGWTARYAAGGAGNPSGSGSRNNSTYSSYDGDDGTGGLLVIYGKSITNYGTLSSTGSSGGYGRASGGSSGGGSINIFYHDNYSSTTTPNVNGGTSDTCSDTAGYGGAGGRGSVTSCSIESGSCVK